jgi:hypothetical protein
MILSEKYLSYDGVQPVYSTHIFIIEGQFSWTNTHSYYLQYTLLFSILFSFILENVGYDPVNWFQDPLMGCDLHFEKRSPMLQF